MTGEASSTWDRIVTQLHAIGLAGLPDQEALARYCLLWQRWREAEAKIDTNGGMFVFRIGADGEVVEGIHKAVKTAGDLADRLLRLGHEFGLTPSGRHRLLP